jgi:outer membrane protein OmpA-like peptidoglycan-associated protein
MRLLFLVAALMAPAALIAMAATPAASQQGTVAGVGGKSAPVAGTVAGVAGRQSDLVFSTKDLIFTVDDLAGKTKDLEVKETKTEIHIDLAADVLFDFDKSTLRPTARDALHQAASIIHDNAKGSTVRIDGYTDAKGSDPYNQRLSDRRAESVKIWFVTKEGLKDVNFATKGYGAKNPVAPNTKPDGSDDPDGRQKNRRVEITVKKS